MLQTLGEKTQARAVSDQNLHIVAVFALEHEGCARIRVSGKNPGAPTFGAIAADSFPGARRPLSQP